jgi:hypothetical protein
MLKLALIVLGVVLGLAILAYAFFIIFFPLVRTVGGGWQLMRMYGWKREKAIGKKESVYPLTHDVELGLTMADGGEKHEEKKEPGTGK